MYMHKWLIYMYVYVHVYAGILTYMYIPYMATYMYVHVRMFR